MTGQIRLATMWFQLVLGALCAGFVSITAASAAFPDRPIRFIVSFPPGGASDAQARILAEALGTRMGVTVIVENQGGAAGTLAAGQVARAPADGYTMLVSATAVFAMVPNMRKLDFDPSKDLRPIARIGESLRALAINPGKLPAKNFAEFLAFAKQNPGKLNYGSSGQGSTVHVLTEAFSKAAGIQMVHIPYRGAGPSLNGILAGDVDVLMDNVVIPHVQGGRLVGLAAAGEDRLPDLPDLPTLAELGLSKLRTSGWTALFGPGRLPQEIVDIYATHIAELYKDETFRRRIASTGTKPIFLGPAPFADVVRDDYEYFGGVIRELGIKAE